MEGLPAEISYQLELNPRNTFEETITRARELFMLEERRKAVSGKPRTVAAVDSTLDDWSGPTTSPLVKTNKDLEDRLARLEASLSRVQLQQSPAGGAAW